MTDQISNNQQSLVETAADIVVAYVANNALGNGDVPKLIADVYQALKGLGVEARPESVAVELKPAVSVRKSITEQFLICLDDGKKFKSLKRHLDRLGMTPAEYREKWNLPGDYPMVAPAYAKTRSDMAKSFGLGRKPVVLPAPPVPPPAPARRGRKAADAAAA